ncbi:formylglycine-generating enzyme family protein [uncultured Enterovirga sp.]|uniref:formylglycine-generating enzyme family protein n=1 Tax=uncultured Enterovirga sp. TaxID=2026352 RepID=UPI0035CC6DDF
MTASSRASWRSVLAALVGPAIVLVPLPGLATGSLPRSDVVSVGNIRLDRKEVSVGRFRAHAEAVGLRTAAEQAGGGHEYAGGWQRRPGWTYLRPYGSAGAADEPAVHVTWSEATAFCSAAGGRLPVASEWRSAAYTEARTSPPDDLVAGRTYRYPSGQRPDGMWTQDAGASRHRPVGQGRPGVNGLHDMGGNVWEWLADRRDGQALTAGGSWWYGSGQTEATGMQWKDADFHAVYIGFRCAYD